jgi:2-dehydropantoate 2-reductase
MCRLRAMRLLVIGAGATGGYFGALAANAGADVTFVQRGPHGAAMRERGVTVLGPGVELQARPRVVASVDEVRGERFDVVLVTVKTADLAAVLPAAAAACAPDGAVITGQNGVDAETVAAPLVPAEKLLGAVLIIGASVPEPGVVRGNGMARVLVGAPVPAAEPAAKRAAAALAACGVPASHTPDLAVARWSKLVWNNAWNVLTCLTGLPVASAARLPEVRALAARAMAETAAVARASGVVLPDNIVDICLMQADAVGETKTSMLQDREAGRPLEVDALCGVVVQRGKALGVPTPVNDTLYPLLLGVHQAVAPGKPHG